MVSVSLQHFGYSCSGSEKSDVAVAALRQNISRAHSRLNIVNYVAGAWEITSPLPHEFVLTAGF